MAFALTLLDGVRWRGEPVVGDRPQALLAALAAGQGRAVASDRLIEDVWGDDVPANAGKALQVLVSRVRAACGPDVIVRDGPGYRLGIPAADVDALRLTDLARRVRRAVGAGDPAGARDAVAEVTALTRALAPPATGDGGALGAVRRAAAAQALELTGPLGRALSATGDHDAALPRLEEAYRRDPADEAVLASLLRSEAAVRGPAAALDRYERYRTRLRDHLGVDPGTALRRVHRDLLALDRPVREGLHYDATPLLGREEDLRRLRELMRTARVVSIVGAGGLGKTRLAHVLGRDAEQPVVHVVELVGCTDAADLVGEVSSALGVRGPVTGRRTLAPQRRSDPRAAIAQHLAAGSGLLILDNCEHLVDAVADLVAYLVATTDELCVLTTTRAPLAIAAERVYQLGELAGADAVELFRQRAVAARASVALAPAVVADVVARLDGLPLAIELAAAKVRVMSVEDVRTRLADRFALLRGGVRNAPDRHQTLLAVIDWSWNLLGEPERRALRRLSVFHDGFTLDAAEAVLGAGALDAVQALVDQSLLAVTETAAGVRYRMLETVREFGRVRLAGAGEEAPAYAARRAWATGYTTAVSADLFGPSQFAAMDAIAAEEANLADDLRRALSTADAEAVVQLLAGLGAFWSVRGDHARVIAVVGGVAATVSGWWPPPELADATRAVLALVLYNSMIGADGPSGPIRDLLVELGPGSTGDPRVRAMTRIMLAGSGDPAEMAARLTTLVGDPDRHVASGALQWLCHQRENDGDVTGAVDAAERALALTRDEDGPWSSAILHTQLAELHLQLGHHDAALTHARAALPVLERLGAGDDLVGLRSGFALAALADGRLDDAAAELERARAISESDGVLAAAGSLRICAAELDLARGSRVAGLAGYRDAIERMRALRIPGARAAILPPWVVHAEATALAAYAVHGEPGEGADLYTTCLGRAPLALSRDRPNTDFPVSGTLLFALGAWGLLRDAMPAPDAVRLLVLADRFAYVRGIPTMAWDNVAPAAERRAPGLVAALRAEYGERRGPDLLDEARDLVERIG